MSNELEAARWIETMRRGDFAAAWEISDRLLRTRRAQDQENLPRWFQSVWNGTAVDGKRVLVRCYHGLGDTIMFARLLPLLKRRAGEVVVWAQPALLELLRTIDGIDHLLSLHDGAPDVLYDVDVELMELPHVLRLHLDDIPSAVPYLHVRAPAKIASSHRRVGL